MLNFLKSTNITQIGEQPADREEWNGKPDKLQYLENNFKKISNR